MNGAWMISMFLIAFSACAEIRHPCIQIAYDALEPENPAPPIGRIHTLFLQNLMGHFPQWQQKILPIQNYRPGQIEACEAFVYLGTYFNTPLPEGFVEDFLQTKKRVLWAGYHVWEIPEAQLKKLWGVSYQGLAPIHWELPDSRGRPSFFKFFHYKGERFEKYGEFDKKDPKKFNASFEMALLAQEPDSSEGVHVLSWAEHSATGERRPYLLVNNNHWYIADSPFSFMHEKDRALIFTDILFDLLDESPKHPQERLGFIRFEDIHPDLPLWQLNTYKSIFESSGVPFGISVIPIFADPFMVRVGDPTESFVTLIQRPLFIDFLNAAKAAGGSFIWHGVTHQYKHEKNPFTGLSGDDFEFWDGVKNRPIPEDSVAYVVNRLTDGKVLLEKAGITPTAWLTPHYQASPLDFVLFGQLFLWGIGRVTYFPHSATQRQKLPPELSFERAGSSVVAQRESYLDDLRVEYDERLLPSGQMYPYEIWGDVYGQRLVPENLGNIQPFLNEQVHMTQSPDQILASAKQNRVLRDHWASLFIHPVLIQPTHEEGLGLYPGDGREIVKLIQGIRDLGYRFINLHDWVEQQTYEIRPQPIEEKLHGVN